LPRKKKDEGYSLRIDPDKQKAKDTKKEEESLLGGRRDTRNLGANGFLNQTMPTHEGNKNYAERIYHQKRKKRRGKKPRFGVSILASF